jgi:hypothetical protein
VASGLDQVWESRTHDVDDPQDGAMELVKLGEQMPEVEDTGSGGVGPVAVVAENPSVEDVRLTKNRTQVGCAWGQAAHDPSSIKASQPANVLVSMKRDRRSSGQCRKSRHGIL